MNLPDDTTLGEAKAQLRAALRAGDRCPCCSQRAQLYRRAIGGAMALVLVEAWQRHAHDWFHLPSLTRVGGDTAKLRYWGLIEEEPVVRPDGGRAGFWRVTDQGARFARGELAVPRYALVFDTRLFGFEGELVTIRDCVPGPFDLEALLEGTA